MDAFTNIFPMGHADLLEGPLMERYLQEKSRPLFDTTNYGCPPDPTLGAINPPQHSFTWSSQSHTSSASAALSPPADSDAMYEGTHGPATPEFSASSPPYEPNMVATQQWDGQHLQHAQFALAYFPPRFRFINPSDINPGHDLTPPADPIDDVRGLEFPETDFRPTDETAIDPNLLPGGIVQEEASVGTAASPANVGDNVTEVVVGSKAAPKRPRKSKSRGNRVPKRTTPIHPRAPERMICVQFSSQVKTERPIPRNQDSGRCDLCNDTFNDTASLQRHVRSTHRRPFTCVFHFAGCQSTFGAKNEWKRHVLSQHLGLYYWHCTLDHCSQASPLHSHGRSSAPGIPTHGSIFNRKDLYTQHVRRMHLGADNGHRKASKEAEERLKILQEAAKKKRCELPVFMECPAVGCAKAFRGANAWDERMEHVAGHLGRAAAGKEEDVLFGGDHDLTLTNWAASPDVGVTYPLSGGGWQHRNPLKGSGSSGVASSHNVSSANGDQDAEGEDCMFEE